MKHTICICLILLLSSCGKIDIKKQSGEAFSFAEQGKWQEASDKIKDCLPQAETNPQIYAIAALCSFHHDKDNKRALEQISEAVKALPDNTDLLFLQAEIAFKAKDYRVAIQALDTYLKSKPNDTHAMMLHIRSHLAKNGQNMKLTLHENQYIERLHNMQKSVETYNLMALKSVFKGTSNNISLRWMNSGYRKAKKLKGQAYLDTLLNRAVIYDHYFKEKDKAIRWYKQYYNEVKNLPVTTQINMAKDRLKALEQL